MVDERSGDTTQLNEAGPTVTPSEWTVFQQAYDDLVPSVTAVALCGSLPPGVPVGAYAVLIRTAKAAGVPVLLDTSGEALRRGVAARPDIVKPNADELAELTGSHEPLRATQDVRRRGAQSVIASLGKEGLLATTPEGRWRAAPPTPVQGNPTGSRRLGGGGPAVGSGGAAALAGPAVPGGRPVRRDRTGPGGGRVRPRGLRGTAGTGHGDEGGRRGLTVAYFLTWPSLSHTWSRRTLHLSPSAQEMLMVLVPLVRVGQE